MTNLEHYKAFAKVCETGSFTLAAQALFLTQSAVSQSIRQLEDYLGAQLFIRSSKGVSLTEAGEILFDHVGGIADTVTAAEQHIARLKGLEEGALNIGASDTLCRHLLLPFLTEFQRRYPGIDIRITNRTSGETADLIRQGKADIGFVNLPLEQARGLVVKELKPVHDCFICGEKYFGSFNTPIHLQELARYPLLMLEGLSATRRYLDQYLLANNISLKPQIELGSLDLLIAFARNNFGIAAVTREFLGDALDGGMLRVITLKKEIPARHIGMMTKKGIPLSFAGREFTQMLPSGGA
ncbi:MAG: LysR family transcriptional regulator [Oscillospiraceae bacterium]|nr:LysR family transcriptional regulator [Oscillospiraceae bacterium]